MSIDEKKLSDFFTNLDEWLVKTRRKLHQYPEVGWTEYFTTYLIVESLKEIDEDFTLYIGKDALVSEERMGVPSNEVLTKAEERARSLGVPEKLMEKMEGGHTGVVAQLDTGKPGPHVAFRFDIDALPILESEADSHGPTAKAFRSCNEGEMHACAHDGHATIGLGLARFISEVKDQLSGKITLLFQPAEEGSRGALSMVEKGWLDEIDYFMSGHIGVKPMEIGYVAATCAGFLATTKINASFSGKSAHAGIAPQEGKNALLAAASATVHLHGITRHSSGGTRINVGKIEAGRGRNIIADRGYLELETRGDTTELNQFMVEEGKRILNSTASLFNVDVKVDIVGEGIGADCDSYWIEKVKDVCKNKGGITHVIPEVRINGSEDATYMIRRVQQNGGKATYMIFGTPLAAGHHHPQFDYDERVLTVGVETFGRMLLNLQEGE
ncbi:aminobenzoyl-glutamate utilization protein A [Evansella vedderi]|uniref:Aminobenzoyl-glutamate utilization protein A n=1 Tax=Evansella vedderi TaxID=38282 RepID=A0ABT9ZQJ2_9BACI|nr:amidohydrolase [Evansella vedderi]MDQ0253119.1 aminobenzoyl-glutamate utilization protein A [Evansella vedderi]